MDSAWAHEIRQFFPSLTYSLSRNTARDNAFTSLAEVVILNTDGVKWLVKNLHHLKGFDHLIIDECSAYKHPKSQRSKAIAKIAKLFKHRYGLTGTPNANSVTELWHQVLILDDGQRLGKSFYLFRNSVQVPTQIGPMPNHLRWDDRPGAETAVTQLLSDITIRHAFEDVMQHVPPNHRAMYPVQLPPKLRKLYDEFERDAVLMLSNGAMVSAPHASNVRNKLLQISSGAVYDRDGQGSYQLLDTTRYELIADLISERKHSVCFANWCHQRDQMITELKKRDISFAVIDGTTPASERGTIVEEFQAGKYQTVIMHPKTGAHGLTLTAADTTIFCSPIYEADLLKQAIHRIYRGSQDKVTNTICIEAENTVERLVYERLDSKLDRMVEFLDILKERMSR